MNWPFRPRTISKLAIEPVKAAPDRDGIAICLIVKNEARHIEEWLRFHRAIGVRQFLIYDNGCSDQTIEIAKKTLSPSELVVLPWDQKLLDGRSGAELHNQVLAYAHALRNFGAKFRWMAFIDVDEFLVPVQGKTLAPILAALDKHAQISLPWHMFGRNGFGHAPDGGVLENYLHRAADPYGNAHALNWKCIVDPARVTAVRVHGLEIDGQGVSVNDRGETAKHSARKERGFYSAEHLQLNHYYTRSGAELDAKLQRGSNKTVEKERHTKRVMRIVNAIEQDTVEDTRARDLAAELGL